ncbi:MAG TPA: hypothetical protein DCZ92_09925 [Elusimicrobia bacterium]|nr:MAG: hypothetical protein A2016_07250 [Elusimicrobia bacterium GWF2_62_30]HBA61118.1 hypothetical protein [Elusimicrobiota bacterium]
MPELSCVLPPEDRLVLLPKNPGVLFLFWQFSASRAEAFRASALGAEVELRLFYSEDKAQASSRRAAWDSFKGYLEVPAQGRTYTAALYALRNGEWEKFLESNPAASPASAGAAEERAYASLEFHKRAQV